MYIKIGNTNIKYNSDVNDYIIFSEVVDSQLSYEKPILVRTKDELDIWFGRNFKDRDYFDELIRSGVTLYLYKPIKDNNTQDIDDYIDIEAYYIFPEIFLDLPSIGEGGYMYYLKTVEPIKHYYKFELVNNRYLWVASDNLDGYTVDTNQYYSIYDLPSVGEDMVAYYVENIPSYRFWYVFENGDWRELRGVDELDLYTPYRGLFASQNSLPQTGIYKYYVLSNKTWYRWKNDNWESVDNVLESEEQEFPIYFDTPDNLPTIGDNYKYYVDGVWYIWLANSWTPETIFPQNIDNISESLNNRDTLMISKPDNNYIPYSYPEFRLFDDNHLGVFSRNYDINFENNYPTIDENDTSDIELGYKTMAVKLSYTSENLDSGYIIIKSQESPSSYCYYTGDLPNVSAIYFSDRFPITTVQDLLDKYLSLGYKITQTSDCEYLIYSNKLFDFNEFYTYKNIKLDNSFDDTENILTNYLQETKGLEFYSKTIGTEYENSDNNIDSLISVKIENTEYEKYRITISRYDYSEIFEGPIFAMVGEERIDNIINNNSKLVMCNIVGLKNYIKQKIYSGVISAESGIYCSDFYGVPMIYKEHYYVPPINDGEVGVKYKVHDELWETLVWNESEEEYNYKYIDRLYPNFNNLTEEILNYPTLEDLDGIGNSEFKYFVESSSEWYIWKNNSWEILEKELLPGDEYSIKVEKSDYETYVIHVLAGEFSETFSGNLFDLQNIINESSEIFKEFKFKNLCNKLREGTFYLRRGKNEEQNKEMYIKSLGCIFDTQIENTWPDYFLVPDIKKYTNSLGEIEDVEKNIFLEHAKEFNCQFLIQNNDPEYKLVNIKTDLGVNSFEDITNKEDGVLYALYNGDEAEYRILENGELVEYTDRYTINESISGGDFIYNYIGDTSNYLVYFFRPLSVLGNLRPGYYTFLRGVINNVFSFEETLINYNSPLGNDPYETEYNSMSTSLERYKSNYLINNNHIFYYKKYFNGSNYYSTIWMRFVIGKIYRELQKNRWTYLSQKSTGIIETNIKNTLSKINTTFEIVNYIILVDFTPKLSENSLELTIETYVKDLMSNNMTLDITVNYNEINTD